MSLWLEANKAAVALSKLAIFWVVMGISEVLSVGAPNCRCYDKHHKSS